MIVGEGIAIIGEGVAIFVAFLVSGLALFLVVRRILPPLNGKVEPHGRRPGRTGKARPRR